MFGSIKKIFSGIVSFLLGLFSSKKSLEGKPNKSSKRNGFFLELEETEVPKELKAVAKSVASATNEVKAKASEATKEVKAKATELVTNKADKEPAATTAKAAPAASEKVKTATTDAPATTEASKEAAFTKKKQQQNIEVELVQTAQGVRAEAVKPAKPVKAIGDSNGKTDTATFAPKYLIPSASNSRRRPGANMNSFLDMARQVKTPG